jgi:RNA polymerase sigma-70 factor (ECF subfamily)
MREMIGLEDLLKRIKSGSEAALQELMIDGSHVMECLARRLLHDKGLAADVVQEAFIRIWSYRFNYDESQPAWPWIASIVRNLCHEAWRREGGRRKDAPFHVDQAQYDFVGAVPCATTPIDEHHGHNQLLALARDHIAGLAPGIREVIQLHLFAELDEREIAESLGIPLGTVKSRKSRDLSALREHLKNIGTNHYGKASP